LAIARLQVPRWAVMLGWRLLSFDCEQRYPRYSNAGGPFTIAVPLKKCEGESLQAARARSLSRKDHEGLLGRGIKATGAALGI